MAEYYTSFLETLCAQYAETTALCVSSLGQDVGNGDMGTRLDEGMGTLLSPTGRVRVAGRTRPYYALQDQIALQRRALDVLTRLLPSDAPIFVFGHSVGAYIALQLLQQHDRVRGVYLLFPTISYIAKAPRASSLRLVLTPWGAWIAQGFAAFLALFPFTWICALISLVTRMDVRSAEVTAAFVTGPGAAWNALCMAMDEMRTITTIPQHLVEHLDKHQTLLRAYFGHGETVRTSLTQDTWVPSWQRQHAEEVLSLAPASDPLVPRTSAVCELGMPHAFCLRTSLCSPRAQSPDGRDRGTLAGGRHGRWR
ncbi:hypothetical protein CBS9595_001316 [Malassezia furfur]|nr:hypothetical protein CBS9595_001316 [Malassezia furfur]